MFFLLRMAFWLGVVCILLPGGGKSSTPDAQIDAVQAVTLASAAVSDARGFCERQPEACATGGKVAVALGQKAEAGARQIFDFISTKLTDKTPPEKPVAAEKPMANTAAKVVPAAAHGTLTPSDMAPNWHAPVPLPPRREARNNRPAA